MSSFAYAGGMSVLLSPDPLPEGYFQKSLDRHLKSFREEKDVFYLKVIDTDLEGKMIAGAKWRINETERTEEEVKKTLPSADEERLVMQDFMGYLSRVRWEYMGTKPFYCKYIQKP